MRAIRYDTPRGGGRRPGGVYIDMNYRADSVRRPRRHPWASINSRAEGTRRSPPPRLAQRGALRAGGGALHVPHSLAILSRYRMTGSLVREPPGD